MSKKIPYHRKRLGQIFLRDALVVERILQSASLAPDELVLEVGPGRGILTAALAQRTHALYAIEVDAHYARTLQQHFASATHVHVIEADARFYDYELLPQPLVVVANLPYSMGMAILQRLLTFRQRLSRLVIMLQKEVAARLLAQPNSSAYGALSVFFQYYTRMTHNFDVSRHAFTPMPAVDSSVITLRPEQPWPVSSLTSLSMSTPAPRNCLCTNSSNSRRPYRACVVPTEMRQLTAGTGLTLNSSFRTPADLKASRGDPSGYGGQNCPRGPRTSK